jgi:glycine hydroxymethyltransferase
LETEVHKDNVVSILKESDPEVAKIYLRELERQECTLEMIAAENFVSKLVLRVQGNIFTNKYAEGQPRKRYYGGCQNMDEIELLAISRAKKLFGAEHVNVQPHAGSQANMAVLDCCLLPGDTILAMSLSDGGHLTHGHKVNFSGKFYRIVQYHVRMTDHLIDFDEVASLAKSEKPKLIIAGASAYPRVIDFEKFADIAHENNALLMADIAHIAGLVAAGVHPSAIPCADFVTTTTHKTLRGPRGGIIMCRSDYAAAVDKCVMPGIQGGPLMHSIVAKAVAFGEALKPEFRQLQQNTVDNAKVLAEALIQKGFSLISGGTDNHLMLVDLRKQGLTGKYAEEILEEGGIIVNRNTIPGDQRKASITSGIRLGTPPLTTRGMGKAEMEIVAGFISKLLQNHENKKLIQTIRQEVRELAAKFPVYPSEWLNGIHPCEEPS